MSELDVEGLKRQVDAQRNTAFTHGVRLELPLDQLNAIIAALEDRDRLRAEIRNLGVQGLLLEALDPRWVSSVEDDQTGSALFAEAPIIAELLREAALERRDG